MGSVFVCVWVRGACQLTAQHASDTGLSFSSPTPFALDQCLLEQRQTDADYSPTMTFTDVVVVVV